MKVPDLGDWLPPFDRLASAALGSSFLFRRFLPAIILAMLGAALATYLAPIEQEAVNDHLAGFPDSDTFAHSLRPVILSVICFIPAIGALYYGMVRSLDRYLIREFFGSFLLAFCALYAIFTLLDLSGNMGDFKEAENGWQLMGNYYAILFPVAFVLLAPFSLLLAMLFSLGKLSRSQEIVSMIQTGRGVIRLILPLACVGLLASLLCLGFNYQWAPWAEGYKDSIIEQANEGSSSQARNVVYYHPEGRRLWFIGSFPFDHNKGEPLQNVVVRTFTKEGEPKMRLQAKTARWGRERTYWIFEGVEIQHLDRRLMEGGPLMPEYEIPEGPVAYKRWSEPPWQIIRPGLESEHLGIPDLYSWLKANHDSSWVNKRRYLTQWHYRWAQPGICLAIVLLAAPLGIVFTRRGAAGGIALAVFLSAGMMFTSTVFLALGESGYLPPIWAAWGTNIAATVLALVLIQRRLVGRPIFQSLKKLLPF
ncbi:LptF/LptG family permease [Akkermansiaceae bacterium]|nr:LptF/LptG family permease [Akkermansiaceae bacterium]